MYIPVASFAYYLQHTSGLKMWTRHQLCALRPLYVWPYWANILKDFENYGSCALHRYVMINKFMKFQHSILNGFQSGHD